MIRRVFQASRAFVEFQLAVRPEASLGHLDVPARQVARLAYLRDRCSVNAQLLASESSATLNFAS